MQWRRREAVSGVIRGIWGTRGVDEGLVNGGEKIQGT